MASADADRLAGTAAAHQGSVVALQWQAGMHGFAASKQRGWPDSEVRVSGRDAACATGGAELAILTRSEGIRALDMAVEAAPHHETRHARRS